MDLYLKRFLISLGTEGHLIREIIPGRGLSLSVWGGGLFSGQSTSVRRETISALISWSKSLESELTDNCRATKKSLLNKIIAES